MKKIFIILLIILSGVSYFLYIKYNEFLKFKSAKVTAAQSEILLIKKGANWKSVAKNLKKKRLITNSKLFYYIIKFDKLGKSLKSGEFEFKGDLTPMDIINKIIKGKTKTYSLTIPEGYNKYDAAKVFEELPWIKNSDKFLSYCNDKAFLRKLGWSKAISCEGLLFPSTYSFARDTTMLKVMEKMHNETTTMLEKYSDKIKSSKYTPYELLTLASIIEKETGVRKEQPIIASVFLNRLKIGMKLQSDPTVIYGMLPDFDGNIRKKDLITDHPYSTYTRQGIPLGPIAFAGENAIKSLLYPETSRFLYFVGTGKGYHYFSKSLKEHNAAVDWYQIKRKKSKFKWRR